MLAHVGCSFAGPDRSLARDQGGVIPGDRSRFFWKSVFVVNESNQFLLRVCLL